MYIYVYIHLKYAVHDLQQRDIKGAAAEIKNENVARNLVFATQPIRKSCSSGFVDDANVNKTNDLGRIFRCLALYIRKIRRHSDHHLIHLESNRRLYCFLEISENRRGDFYRRNECFFFLILHLEYELATILGDNFNRRIFDVQNDVRIIVTAPDEAFDGMNCVLGISSRLLSGRNTDKTLLGSKSNNRPGKKSQCEVEIIYVFNKKSDNLWIPVCLVENVGEWDYIYSNTIKRKRIYL